MANGTSGTDVVVLGGGLAGLSASLAFARSGRRVTLLERDGPTEDGDADEQFERWARPGISQFRQPHNFLALARQVLLEEAPDVLDAVAGLGALENRQYDLLPGGLQPEDEALVSICARRPVFEVALRRAVDAEPEIRIETGTRVVGLVAASGSDSGAVVITGVRTERGQEIEAGLVVDALGRTSPVASWLDSLSARPLLERRAEWGLLYYSRHFRCVPASSSPWSRPSCADRVA